MQRKWGVAKAARSGAAVGAAYIAALAAIDRTPLGVEHAANVIGEMIGAAVAGALIFGIAAVIRNAAAR